MPFRMQGVILSPKTLLLSSVTSLNGIFEKPQTSLLYWASLSYHWAHNGACSLDFFSCNNFLSTVGKCYMWWWANDVFVCTLSGTASFLAATRWLLLTFTSLANGHFGLSKSPWGQAHQKPCRRPSGKDRISPAGHWSAVPFSSQSRPQFREENPSREADERLAIGRKDSMQMNNPKMLYTLSNTYGW